MWHSHATSDIQSVIIFTLFSLTFFSKHLQMSQYLWQRFKKCLTFFKLFPHKLDKKSILHIFQEINKDQVQRLNRPHPQFWQEYDKKAQHDISFLKGKKFGELFWDHSPKHKCGRIKFTVLLQVKNPVIFTKQSQKLYFFWTRIHLSKLCSATRSTWLKKSSFFQFQRIAPAAVKIIYFYTCSVVINTRIESKMASNSLPYKDYFTYC